MSGTVSQRLLNDTVQIVFWGLGQYVRPHGDFDVDGNIVSTREVSGLPFDCPVPGPCHPVRLNAAP